jgi:hypothetical protein
MEYEVEKAPEPETVEKLDETPIEKVGRFFDSSHADPLKLYSELFANILQGVAAASHYRFHHQKIIATREEHEQDKHTWGHDYGMNGEEIAHCARLADIAFTELQKRAR